MVGNGNAMRIIPIAQIINKISAMIANPLTRMTSPNPKWVCPKRQPPNWKRKPQRIGRKSSMALPCFYDLLRRDFRSFSAEFN